MAEEPKEKLEFLKREEIRTMAKDIARLREEEAKKERERIAALKTEEEARIEREKAERIKREAAERRKLEERKKIEVLKEKLEKPPPKVPPVPPVVPPEVKKKVEKILIPEHLKRKLSRFEKIFIRVALVIILILIFTNLFLFWYWYLRVYPTPPPEVIPTEVIPPKKVIPEIVIPSSLISAEATKTIEISTLEELPVLISQVLQESLVEGQFTRIIIKNLAENKILGLKEFFEAFEVKAPENFYDKLENDFTLFIYSQAEGNRLGFVTKIKEKKGLTDLLKSWEKTLEKDFENIFILMGKEKPALVPSFKESDWQEVGFRFQTFTREDLGICYSIFDDYFIFTSSWESLTKTIDKLTQ